MAVLGLITCEILELEFAHLLAADPDLAAITVVEDDYSQGFIQRVQARAPERLRRLPQGTDFRPARPGRLEALVLVLELGLHNRKRLLQEGLAQAAREMGRLAEALVLGYGLCGNALEKPEELLAEAGVPLFLPRDEDHPVDDCVGLIIGGREVYYGEQCRVAGTFFMIPGFARHWKRMLEREFQAFDLNLARRMFAAYERSLLIPLPLVSEEEMRQDIEEFNRLFGLRTEVRPGTLELLHKTWTEAKRFLLEEKNGRSGASPG